MLLILGSAPEALSSMLAEAFLHDLAAEALVGLLRGDVVDGGMVMFVVIPVKVSLEIIPNTLPIGIKAADARV